MKNMRIKRRADAAELPINPSAIVVATSTVLRFDTHQFEARPEFVLRLLYRTHAGIGQGP